MNNALYVHLTRQTALLKEIDIVATNLTNMNTTGYRREGAVFSEYIEQTDDALGSLSMTAARARYADLTQGPLEQTGAQLDLAIEGDGFFQVQGPNGVRLTRAGSFALSPEGQLVTLEGLQVLDNGGAPIQLPPDARQIGVGPDGTISADGQIIGQVGVVTTADPNAVRREAGTLHVAQGPIIPAETAKIAQGFVESSNVSPVAEMTRMMEVQRAYELGQALIERDDQLLGSTIQTLGEPLV